MNDLGYSYIEHAKMPKGWAERETDYVMAEAVWKAIKESETPLVFRLKRESRPTWHFSEPATEHRVSVRITPVLTERIVMREMPRIDPVAAWPLMPTIGQRIKSWWREMTSPVVYDGPRG
jgi:hypothetical protein